MDFNKMHAGAVQKQECSNALGAGVKAILVPFAVDGGILALDGRSKALDARADGYGRSEAVAAVLVDGTMQATSLAGSAIQAGANAELHSLLHDKHLRLRCVDRRPSHMRS